MKDPRTGYGRDPVHGMTYSPTWYSWSCMIRRCYDPNASQFAYYGGRRIRVDPRWRDFELFFADMGERPEGMTLSRVENDGDYEPGNVEWANHRSQMRNRRNTVWVRFNGENMTLREFADLIGVVPSALYNRRAEGWSSEEIVAHYSDPNWKKWQR